MSTKRLILATIVGAVISFAWGFVSWVVLPWHTMTFNALPNEAAVSEALAEGATADGIYLIPWMDHDADWDGPEGQAWQEKHRSGPVAFISVNPDGGEPMDPAVLGMGFLLDILAAAIAVMLLRAALPVLPAYSQRVMFLVGLGGVAAMIFVIEWNYWGFEATYTLVNVVDTLVDALLVGLAVAAIVKPDGAAAAAT